MFQQGDFSWGLSRPVLLAVVAAAAIALLALLTYRGVSPTDRPRDRAVLVGLRLAALAVLLFCLFRPTLILKAAVPQQNFLGVLIDDSRSMAIADRDGQARSAFVQEQLNGPNAKLLARCRSASSSASSASRRRPDRVAAAADLKFGGTSTRLAPGARSRARRAGGPAARRPGHGVRRRRHLRRRDRRNARQPQGAIDSGVHRRRRPGALRARHPGDARRDAAHRAQGHRARRRRRAVADRLRRPDRPAQRRRRRADREHAGSDAAARRRVGDGQGALHRQRSRRARCSGSRCRRRPASRSRRTTRATR